MKVGDRVKCVNFGLSGKYGRDGEVKEISDDSIWVLLDGDNEAGLYYPYSFQAVEKPYLTPEQKELVDAASALREAQERFDKAVAFFRG